MEKKVTIDSTVDRKKWAIRQLRDNNSILILVILLLVAFTLVSGFRTSFYQAILTSAEYGLVALGLGIIMMTGNIDLSLGYMAASCGVTMVTVFNALYTSTANVPLSLGISVLVALILGGILGCFNGFIITKVGISPLIATIATNYVFNGYVLQFASSSYSPTDRTLVQGIGTTRLFGIRWFTPMLIIFLVLIVLVALWMYKTRFGNSIKLVGDNSEAAQFAGINSNWVVFVSYVMAGVLAGLCGFLMVSYTGAAVYTQGATLATLPISCCIIGGIKMTGGKGTAIHILLGVLIMRIISQIMSALHLNTAMVNLVTGALLIVILLVDRFTRANKADD